MLRRSRYVRCALLLGGLGCSDDGRPGHDAALMDAGRDAAMPIEDAALAVDDAGRDAALPWPDAGADASLPTSRCRPALAGGQVVDVDGAGRSANVTLEFDTPLRQVEVALLPEGSIDGHTCFGVESVELDGEVWVGPGSDDTEDVCVSCAQPVRLHPAQGMFVLPSGPSVTPFTSLTLRVAMRDCDTLLRPSPSFPVAPGQVRVVAAPIAVHADDDVLVLRTGLVAAAPSLGSMSDEARAAYLGEVEQTVNDAFLAANIELVWSRASVEHGSPLVYAPAEREELDALFDAARAALEDDGAVPLILSPCLERGSITGTTRPRGTTPHVPGSCNVPRAGVYVAGESCLGGGLSFPDPGALGVIVAHELGHHLGLFHVGEAGFPTDREASEANLMQAAPVSSLTLTPEQVAVVRRHPDLTLRQSR